MKIMKAVITLLGSIHTPEFCHCTPVCSSELELELYCKIQLFGLFFSQAFENWLRVSKGARFSLKRKRVNISK